MTTTTTEIVPHGAPPMLPSTEAVSVQSILQIAVERGVDVGVLERLVALQERVGERQAATEFNHALTDFQAECPSIRKTSTARVPTKSGGEYSYSFADLDQIARTVRPLLVKHGLSYTWDSDLSGKHVVCTCTLRHVGGHSQSAKFVCPTDSASAMSEQQKHAAALTYSRRQSLVQVLGLTTTDKDTDAAAPVRISEAQAMTIEEWLESTSSDRTKFLKYMRIEKVSDMLARDFDKAIKSLEAKARAQKGGAQ